MGPTLYDAVGGMPVLVRLAEAWHARCLADPELAHPFSHPGQHPRHTERLAAYWAEALGGPATYTTSMGDQSHVLRMHSGNGEHPAMDRRAVELFVLALDDADVPDQPALRSALTGYFGWATGELGSHPSTADDVPPDLPLPRWSWDGPVTS